MGFLFAKINTFNVVSSNLILGATEDSPRSEKKLKVDLPGLSNDQCQRILGNEYPIVDTQVSFQ